MTPDELIPPPAGEPRLDRLSCRRCGHEDELPRGLLADEEVLRCDVCGARIAFGQTMPRVVIEPYRDPRFVVVTIDNVTVIFDRAYAALIAKHLASVTWPLACTTGARSGPPHKDTP